MINLTITLYIIHFFVDTFSYFIFYFLKKYFFFFNKLITSNGI